jgi:hypothetical protein
MSKSEVTVAQLDKLNRFERRIVDGTELRISGGTMATTPMLAVEDEVVIILKGRVQAVDHKSKTDGETAKLVRQHVVKVQEAIVLADDAVRENARGQHTIMHSAMFGDVPTLGLKLATADEAAE